MDTTTMIDDVVAATSALARVRSTCPRPADARLLADTLGWDQGTTVSTPVAVSRIRSDVAVAVAGSMAQAPIQGNGFVPFAGYAPTTPTFMDVASIRSGSPPV